MSSPTTRSMEQLRKAGWLCQKVEQPWNPHTKATKDLWGFGDILAVRQNEVLIVQTTSGSNVAARLDKIRAIPAARLWLASPTRRILVHGWSKRGARGKRKLWTCREVELTLDDLEMWDAFKDMDRIAELNRLLPPRVT